jgi:hypothetical protein
MRLTKVRQHDKEEPGRLRVAAHNLGEPMAVRPRVLIHEQWEHSLATLVSRFGKCENSSGTITVR